MAENLPNYLPQCSAEILDHVTQDALNTVIEWAIERWQLDPAIAYHEMSAILFRAASRLSPQRTP